MMEHNYDEDIATYNHTFISALTAKNIEVVKRMMESVSNTLYTPIITNVYNEGVMVSFMEHIYRDIEAASGSDSDSDSGSGSDSDSEAIFKKIIAIYADDSQLLYSDYQYLYDMMHTCPGLSMKAFILLPQLKLYCSDLFFHDLIMQHNTPLLVEFIQFYVPSEGNRRGDIYREIIRDMTEYGHYMGGYRNINEILYIFKHLIIAAEKNHTADLSAIINGSLNVNTIASIRNGFLLFKKLNKYIHKKIYMYEDSSGFTPLCDAARYGTLNTFRYIEKYSSPSCYKHFEYTDVLNLSVLNSDTRILEYIIKSPVICKIIGADKDAYKLNTLPTSYRVIELLCTHIPKLKNRMLSDIISNTVTPIYICKKILRIWDFTLKLEIERYTYFYDGHPNIGNPTITELISTKHGYHDNLLYIALNKLFNTSNVIVPVILESLETYTNLIYRSLFEGFMKNCNEENFIRSIKYLIANTEFINHTLPIINLGRGLRGSRVVEILFVNGVNTDNQTRRCKLVIKTLRSYIIRRFNRLRNVHRDNFSPTKGSIARPKLQRMVFRKTVNPEHITPTNYLDFIQRGGPYYISPKADGVSETIKLYDYYPKVNCVGLSGIQFKSERVKLLNGRFVNLIYGDYETIKTLQALIAEYVVDGFAAFVEANKDPLWWPKPMEELDPYTADLDIIKNETNSEYPTDGWILSSPNSPIPLKLKPDCHLTLDLLHDKGKFYYGREHTEFAAIHNAGLLCGDGLVYRCYPGPGQALWEPREIREEKLKPNNAAIVAVILAYFKNKWTFAELRPYYSQLYYQQHGVFPYKKSIEDITHYFHYFKTGGRTLDIGCGFKTRKYMAKIPTKEYIGIDIDYALIQYVKQKDTCGNYYTMDWSRPKNTLFGDKPLSGYFDNLLCINSMAAVNNGEAINKLTRAGCIFIIRFLDNDLLQKILPDEASFISDKENFVRYYGAGRKRIKYYHSHCHTKPLIENSVNKADIMTLLDHKWKIKKYSYAADIVGGTWENYLKCFSVLVIERLPIYS
jgi:hypothetical protein